MTPTIFDKQLAQSRTKKIFVKIDILNSAMFPIDRLEGRVVSGSIDISANNNFRRTCSLKIINTGNYFDINNTIKYWIDKYFKLYIGIQTPTQKDTVWYDNYGLYLIDSPSLTYSTNDNTVSIKGIDLMGKLTGDRGGNVDEIPNTISKGSDIRNAIISILTNFTDFKKFQIDAENKTVPYDLTFDYNSSIYDILDKLRNLYSDFEMFFDSDGVFVYRKIPTGNNEGAVIEKDYLNKFVISSQVDIDYTNIRNRVFVYGRSYSTSNYTDIVQFPDNHTYKLLMSGVNDLDVNGELYGFKTNTILTDPYIQINDFPKRPLVDMDGDFVKLRIPESYFVIQIDNTNNTFVYLGNQQIVGEAREENPESPYYYGYDNPEYYAETSTLTNSTYHIDVDEGFDIKKKYSTLGFKVTDYTPTQPLLEVNGYAARPIVNYKGEHYQLQATDLYQIVEVDNINNTFIYRGSDEKVDTATAKTSNYYNNGSAAGKLQLVLSGGEYDNITTDELAEQRARYELYLRTKVNDTLSLSLIPLYFLTDVNQKITYGKQDEDGREYLITDISFDLSVKGEQTIKAIRYYPSYDSVIGNDDTIWNDYTPLSYLQQNDDRTAYIDTLYVPTQDTQIELQCELIDDLNVFLFGSRRADTDEFFLYYSGHWWPRLSNKYETDYKLVELSTGLGNNTATILFNRNDVTLNGLSILSPDFKEEWQSAIMTTNTQSLYLFALHAAGDTVDSRISKIRLFYFKIYEKGVVKKLLLPAKRNSDNKLGLLDTLNNVFYINQGSGNDFTGA